MDQISILYQSTGEQGEVFPNFELFSYFNIDVQLELVNNNVFGFLYIETFYYSSIFTKLLSWVVFAYLYKWICIATYDQYFQTSDLTCWKVANNH